MRRLATSAPDSRARNSPGTAQQIEHAVPGSTSYYCDFRVILEEVFRFDPGDTLVFGCALETAVTAKSSTCPSACWHGSGEFYYAPLAEASGIVSPKATPDGYFAITGTPRGGRANLAVTNQFGIVVSRVDRPFRTSAKSPRNISRVAPLGCDATILLSR